MIFTDKNKKFGSCKLCLRGEVKLTSHHLIPRTLHSNKWFKKNYEPNKLLMTVPLCEDCHRMVHNTLSEKDLGKNFNTLELLLSHPKVYNFIRWVRRQKKSKINNFKQEKNK